MYKYKYCKYKNKYDNLKQIMSLARNVSMIMNYNNRINYYNQLNNNVKSNDDCKSKNIIITKGGHSTICKKVIYINDNILELSLKEQIVNKTILQNKYNINDKVWLEYFILKKCTELVLNKHTQNLPMIYDINICIDDEKLIFYNELATGDFINWCYSDHTEEEWLSFLFQFWIGLYTLQKHLKLVHNDLRLGNILYHKINTDNKYWKYNVENTEYYIPNTGYVFVIWDFGSSNLIKDDSKDINKDKFDLNIDLHFFHDLYNRLRVILLLEMYSINELECLFVSEKEIGYVKNKKNECEKRFRKAGRFDEKYKIALIYYLIENNKFDDLIKDKKDKKDIKNTEDDKKIIKLPPKKIMDLLKELSDENYHYEDVLKLLYGEKIYLKHKIPSPISYINKYFKNYVKKQDFDLEFDV